MGTFVDPSLDAILRYEAEKKTVSDQDHPDFDSGIETTPRYNTPKYVMPHLKHSEVQNK